MKLGHYDLDILYVVSL